MGPPEAKAVYLGTAVQRQRRTILYSPFGST